MDIRQFVLAFLFWFSTNTVASSTQFEDGINYLKMGLYDESITKFSQILSQEPENAPAYCQLGAAYRLRDRLSNSITAYQKALTLETSTDVYGTAHLYLAMIYQKEGVFNTAKSHELEAVKLLPQTAKAYLVLGEINLYYQDDKEAKSNLLHATKIDANLTEAYQLLGQQAISNNQINQGITYLEKALTLDPYQSSTYYHLVAAYRSIGHSGMVKWTYCKI